MKLQKLTLMLTLIVALGSFGCRKASTPPEQSAENAANATELQHPAGGTTVVAETKFFKGSIGEALDLQMKLVRAGDNLSGSYFYQKVGKKIDVRGTIDQTGNLTLEEFDANGKQTGVFKGSWKQGESGAIEISGNWTKPNNDKQSAFSLHEEPIEFTGGVEIVARSIKEKNKKLKYEVDAQYPQLTGSADPNFEKFNRTVRSLITQKVADFKRDMAPTEGEAVTDTPGVAGDETLGSDIVIGYTVALARDDLIGIEFTVSSYSAGAAHPNSYTEVVNFDLKNGKLLKLADLFQPGAKYLQTLSTYSIQDLKKQAKAQGSESMLDDDWIQKGASDMSNYDNWTVTKKGLAVTFDPYQVAPYAAGPQHVVTPYAALKQIIKPDGPVGQFVK